MVKPPPYILEHFGLPQMGWHRPDTQGMVASTWVSKDWVLQHRPIHLVDRMLMLHNVASRNDIAGLAFAGDLVVERADGTLSAANNGASGECIWNLQPRLYSLKSLYRSGMGCVEIIENAEHVLAGVLLQLDRFAAQVKQYELFCTHNTPGIAIQKAEPIVLKQFARRVCPLVSSPVDHLPEYEPSSPVVSSHGDSIIKNMILTPEGTCLIDWEAASALPRHMDFTHMVAFLCKCTEPRYWNRILDGHWEAIQPYLPGWTDEEWRLAAAWYMVRELVAFPPSKPEVRLRFWAGLADFVYSL